MDSPTIPKAAGSLSPEKSVRLASAIFAGLIAAGFASAYTVAKFTSFSCDHGFESVDQHQLRELSLLARAFTFAHLAGFLIPIAVLVQGIRLRDEGLEKIIRAAWCGAVIWALLCILAWGT